MRPNYLIFMGYLKDGGRVGVRVTPWTPLDLRLSIVCFLKQFVCKQKYLTDKIMKVDKGL